MSECGRPVFDGWKLLAGVRRERPLIHCITNYVTANDTANMLLAMGAFPIMAEAVQEAKEITALSQALVLNLGTLNETKAEAMRLSGKMAASLGRPVILDPVGAGASRFRTDTARQLIKEIPCTVIRANASEIRALSGLETDTRGVDAGPKDRAGSRDMKAAADLLKKLSRDTGAVIVMTGATDLVADEGKVFRLHNGHPMMAQITGTGCMMNGILAAFLAAGSAGRLLSGADSRLWRTVYAVAAAGICGEYAFERTAMQEGGSGSFRVHYIDAMSCLTDDDIAGGMKLEF